MEKLQTTAYFSMEIALQDAIPNYAGGLGILAGDTLHSCADLGSDVVGVSLIYHQSEEEGKMFNAEEFLTLHDEIVEVEIEGRNVKIMLWELALKGRSEKSIPIIFLSSNHPDNKKWDRDLTKYLYAADRYTRLGQELILGIAGVRALEILGYNKLDTYHMNEGHSSLLTLELLKKHNHDAKKVRDLCTFTTHTPVPAGHDHFEYKLAYSTIHKALPLEIKEYATYEDLSTTDLALNLSRVSNSVSAKHREVCEGMFPRHDFENVTNGIYHPRWVGGEIKTLLDEAFAGWEEKPELLKDTTEKIDSQAIVAAHKKQKHELVDWLNSRKELFPFEKIEDDDSFGVKTLTIGFARRYVPYKRHTLIFKDMERLRNMGYRKIQLIFAGNCHEGDSFCNQIKQEVERYSHMLRGQIRVAILTEYNIEVAKKLITGCDVWLNNPIPPREASGTSGMKAALNGGLNLSILDGWWIEGYNMNKKAGWAFGNEAFSEGEDQDAHDSKALLVQLEDLIDCYYNRTDEWAERMKNAISLVGHFNTHRLVNEYQEKIWTPKN
ncbi:alpha-glucan family phosphorylase [bacterium]|nr:alpha-glucan family phosphorylase [bacterium]MBT4251627.1 alpha-glucan family phosphorylase [bacterium]MBT4597676.1 alpha-glucan family phosphorylase [bacterium]MBT6753689.1 alpha-glucan family phosphorylase [bacterium]MBT7037826.1 alpha-glucan family phosphorylase [bacterium]